MTEKQPRLPGLDFQLKLKKEDLDYVKQLPAEQAKKLTEGELNDEYAVKDDRGRSAKQLFETKGIKNTSEDHSSTP